MQFMWPGSSEASTSQATLVFAITGIETAHRLDWVNLWSHGGMSVNWADEVMITWHGLRIGRYAYTIYSACELLVTWHLSVEWTGEIMII
jgi:hypothetical protein